MTEVYEALGKEIILNALMKASDVNDVVKCLEREIERRNISDCYTDDSLAGGNPIVTSVMQTIDKNCRELLGYTDTETFNAYSAAQMQRYIAYIKELYSKIVVL